MNNELVKLRFFGDISKHIAPEWNLNVNSVTEAIGAINTLTGNSVSDYFFKQNKLHAKYRILINGRDFYSPVKEINETNLHLVNQSELFMKKNDLETIDIVPVLESSVGVIISLVIAIVASVATFFLTRPPKFDNFRNINKAGGESYLFGGPTNVVGDGGPIPIGYGRAMVGSQVISSAYKIQDYQTYRSDVA
jgi:predicted phage tail protein